MAGEAAEACAPLVNELAPREAASFDEETRGLIAPDAGSLPATPPSAGRWTPSPRMAGEAAEACAPLINELAPREAASFDEETRALIAPDAGSLPATPPSAVEANFARYFVADYLNPGHDQYVYRHPNGLCVVGLAPAHVALKEEGGITAIDFNVGKTDRSEIKVTGKRKRNAQHLQENSVLCKVSANDKSFVVRCCVKGSLLEINGRLIKQPNLLNNSADREGYIGIFMPKPADWLKVKDKFLSFEDYKNLRGIC